MKRAERSAQDKSASYAAASWPESLAECRGRQSRSINKRRSRNGRCHFQGLRIFRGATIYEKLSIRDGTGPLRKGGTMKRYPDFFHIPTGCYRQVLGARLTEAGKAFATITREDARERVFLLEGFDQARKVEAVALWEALGEKENARIKAKARKDRALEKMRYAREQSEWRSEDPEQDQADAGGSSINRGRI